MLYLVATPIGNLGDITYRAVDTLKGCDLILCEDTRRSRVLCDHYGISTPLKSYHQFNQASSEQDIVERLQAGQEIALVSDAGTPLISDPGESLVATCREHGIEVIVIPGPCAAIAALTGSGLPCETFRFWGFLPRKPGALRETLLELLTQPFTHITYESPKRVQTSVRALAELCPSCTVCIARELTKKFETYMQGPASDIAERLESEPVKGEIVLLIHPPKDIIQSGWALMDPGEQVESIAETFGLERSAAIKLAAELRGCPKRLLYQALLDSDA